MSHDIIIITFVLFAKSVTQYCEIYLDISERSTLLLLSAKDKQVQIIGEKRERERLTVTQA
jgi:hypothetical protein